MTEELEFLWYHMRGDFGLLMAAISWVTALRLVFKPLSKYFESYIAQVGQTEGAWAVRLMTSQLWRLLAFTLDYLASVKLPVKNGNTENK